MVDLKNAGCRKAWKLPKNIELTGNNSKTYAIAGKHMGRRKIWSLKTNHREKMSLARFDL